MSRSHRPYRVTRSNKQSKCDSVACYRIFRRLARLVRRAAVPPAHAHRKHVLRAPIAMYIEPAAFRAPSAESLAGSDSPTVWTQCLPTPLFAGKKAPLKTYEEVQPLLQQGRKRELKILIRENSWPINSPVRASLWPALCRQHQHGKSMLDGFYWDMVTQVSALVVAQRHTALSRLSTLVSRPYTIRRAAITQPLSRETGDFSLSRSCLFTLRNTSMLTGIDS